MENHSPRTRTIMDLALLDPETLSNRIGVSEGTLANWRWRRIGPRWIKAGAAIRYRVDDVEAWLETQAQGGDGGAAA